MNDNNQSINFIFQYLNNFLSISIHKNRIVAGVVYEL